MNPSKSGWLADFIEYRKSAFLKTNEFNQSKLGKHPDQSFYGIIQPTGIMYGHPVNAFGIKDENIWTDNEGIKVLMADSLLNISALYSETKIETESSCF